jgi:hypothetical protein
MIMASGSEICRRKPLVAATALFADLNEKTRAAFRGLPLRLRNDVM